MRLGLPIVLLAGAAVAGATQITVPSPQMPSQTPLQMPSPGATFDMYGQPQPVELSELFGGGGPSVKRAVRTRGHLMPLDFRGEYFQLSDAGGRVVLIPIRELGNSLRELNGRRVEVVGLVRRLVERQGTCVLPDRTVAPTSYCDDPLLPPTPDLTGDKDTWPNVSITAWTILDITPLDWGKRGAEQTSLAELVENPPHVNKTVKVLGRFCGAGLCGGLSDPPHPTAWVLQDGEAAVWVLGKPPQGKGWRLDPTYAGDTSRWIEVAGKLLPCGTGAYRCLRAESLLLAPRPEASPP